MANNAAIQFRKAGGLFYCLDYLDSIGLLDSREPFFNTKSFVGNAPKKQDNLNYLITSE